MKLGLKSLSGVSLIIALTASGACHDPHPKAPVRSDKPPVVAAPLGYARSDANAAVSLSLPEAIKSYPDLHGRLYAQSASELDAFMGQAGHDAAELKSQGFLNLSLSKTIKWYVSASSAHLVSTYAEIFEDSGGAHPNSAYQSVLWDKAGGREILPRDLITPGADTGPLDSYLCQAITESRARRLEQARPPATNCPRFMQGRIILVPSLKPDHFAAIDVLYAPYEVGAYAEGPYIIRLPLTVVQPVIAPAYAADFDGAPIAPPTGSGTASAH